MHELLELAPTLWLTGDGGAWLPASRVLVVADVHVGYELAAQRRGGYLPPVGRGAAVGERLLALVERLRATRLVVAGDLRHSTRDADVFEREELGDLARVIQKGTSLELVLGNHDRGGALIDGVTTHAELRVDDVDIVHRPPRVAPERWTVCGHLHPRVTVRDETGASARFPCVLTGGRTVVLPAYSDWAGGAEAARLVAELPAARWRALPISAGAIADVGIVFDRESC